MSDGMLCNANNVEGGGENALLIIIIVRIVIIYYFTIRIEGMNEITDGVLLLLHLSSIMLNN